MFLLRQADFSQEVQELTSGIVRIALADEHTLFRAGLRKLLTAEAGFEVVAESPAGPEVLLLVERHRPDVLLLDLNMPGVDALEILRELHERAQQTRILVLTAS